TLADLGLNLDDTGHLNFDSSKLGGANMADVQNFLGSMTSGGFLQSASSALSSVTDSTTGMIHVAFTSLQSQVDSDNTEISADQDRITQLQGTLTAQLSEADAAISALESQKNYMLMLFQAEFPAAPTS